MYQESELFNLVFAVISAGFIASFRLFRLQFPPYMTAGFAAVMAGYVFTVAEGYVQPELLDLLEHLSYAAAGIFFAQGCRCLARGEFDAPSTGG